MGADGLVGLLDAIDESQAREEYKKNMLWNTYDGSWYTIDKIEFHYDKIFDTLKEAQDAGLSASDKWGLTAHAFRYRCDDKLKWGYGTWAAC